MRIGKGLCLHAAKLTGPEDDILDAEQKQQRCRLGKDHPQVRQAGKRIDPHLRHVDPPEHLARVHAESLRRLDLRLRHRVERSANGVGGEGAEDNRKGKHGQQETVDLVHPLRIGIERQLGGGADDEIIALADWFCPVGTDHLVAQIFETLVDRQRHEQEEDDLRNTAHHRDITTAEPSQRRKGRPARQRTAEPEQQRRRRGDRQQQQHRPEGQVEGHMLAGGQIAAEPGNSVEQGWILAAAEHQAVPASGRGIPNGAISAAAVPSRISAMAACATPAPLENPECITATYRPS